MDQRLVNIIRDYKKRKQNDPDSWVEHAKNQKNLSAAIKVSALSVNERGKRNPHQRFATRWIPTALNDFASELSKFEVEIKKAKTFDQIHDIVSKVKIKGISDLAIYDTAMRIGMYREIPPDKIFLHAGTRRGAEKILGRIDRPFILAKELPVEFHNIPCWQIEDILCIYKHILKPTT